MVVTANPNAGFQQICTALTNRFHPQEQRQLHEAAFRARQKRSDETQYAFAADLRRLAGLAFPVQAGPLFENIIVSQFIDGQSMRELRVQLSSPRPATLDEAIRRAIELNSVYTKEFSRSASAAPFAYGADAVSASLGPTMVTQNGAQHTASAVLPPAQSFSKCCFAFERF